MCWNEKGQGREAMDGKRRGEGGVWAISSAKSRVESSGVGGGGSSRARRSLPAVNQAKLPSPSPALSLVDPVVSALLFPADPAVSALSHPTSVILKSLSFSLP